MTFPYFAVLDLTHISYCVEVSHAIEVIPRLRQIHVKPILCFLFGGSSVGAPGE